MEIGLNTYSLRNEWPELGPDRKIAVVKALCKDLEIDKVELLDRDFDPKKLKEITAELSDEGITVFAIGPHVKFLQMKKDVSKAVEEGKFWLNLAAEAGVKYIRFQGGNGPMPPAFDPMDDFDDEEWEEYNDQMKEAVEVTAEVLDPLIEEAEKLNVYIGYETHGSYSSNAIYMKFFNERFTSAHVGWIFDIGNFSTDKMRWAALEEIKTRTFYIHSKAYAFDENGFETKLDYPKAAKVLYDAGFRGVWSIEFEGKANGIWGVYKTYELVKYSIAVAEGRTYRIKTDIPAPEELMKKYGK